MNNVQAITDSRELHPGVEGFWAHEVVTPAREVEGRRAVDASKLTFPLQLVIQILALLGALWVITSGLRSDVRDILTRMEMQARTDAEKASILHEQINSLAGQISAAERRQELLRLEFQQLREQVLFKGKGAK